MQGEGGAAGHGVVFQFVGACGGRVADAPDDDRAVVALRLGFVRLALNPEIDFQLADAAKMYYEVNWALPFVLPGALLLFDERSELPAIARIF